LITVQVEKWSDVKDEFPPLLLDHWVEIARNKDIVPLAFDWELYAAAEKLGKLHVVTARDDKKLIGYNLHFVSPHPHYKTTLFAQNDIIYLKPEYRGSGAGKELIRIADEKLKALGVKIAYLHIKTEHDFSSLARREGYVEIEKIYERVL
jgi:GNAT superfamily N-acetyltransferase